MKILHRISFNSQKDAKFFEGIRKIGIKYKSTDMPGGKNQFIYFDVAESDPFWPEVSQLVQKFNVIDGFDTYFSESEILNAEWARLISTYSEGYPEPYETWVTNPTNYKNNCRECGTFQQEGSFQIKKEPTLKGNDFMSLSWVNRSFFCTPKVLKGFEAHRIKGYEVWNVMLTKTNSPSQNIYQLLIPNNTTSGLLNEKDLNPVKCKQCHITRYSHHRRGAMQIRRSAFDPDLDIVRSFEWFGTGRDAYQEVFVSNRVIKMIIKNGWKGLRLKVVELV